MKALSAEDAAWWQRFEKILNEQTIWPSIYVFKFIVPSPKVGDVEKLFDGQQVDVRPSKKGKYSSVTARLMMNSSSEVIAIYRSAANIEDLIAL